MEVASKITASSLEKLRKKIDSNPHCLTPQYVCPNCGGSNLWVGNFPLACDDCDWNYLNKHPCKTCGKPSYACVNQDTFCREHCPDIGEAMTVFAQKLYQGIKAHDEAVARCLGREPTE